MDTRHRKQRLRCTVVGGAGFLGRHLVEQLLERGYEVNVLDIRQTYDDDQVKFFTGDLCKKEDVMPALEDVYCVFHCATPSPLSCDRDLFHKVNVEGTANLIEACKSANVKRLVLTSSASVVYEGRDVKDGDEQLPYAAKPMDFYTETKILQEKLVLESNCEDLLTVAIRPHGIFGPRDPHMLPTVVRTARAGKMRFRIGSGQNLVDFTYVVNVAYAHVLAAEKLLSFDSPCCGKAYNITNKDPIFFWAFLSKMLTGLDYKAPTRHLPFMLIYIIALILQVFVKILSPIKVFKPTFTPMTVSLAATHHFYNCDRATQHFGYSPIVSLESAIESTIKSFPQLRNQENNNKSS